MLSLLVGFSKTAEEMNDSTVQRENSKCTAPFEHDTCCVCVRRVKTETKASCFADIIPNSSINSSGPRRKFTKRCCSSGPDSPLEAHCQFFPEIEK